MPQPKFPNKDPKRVRHVARKFAQANGKRAFLNAAVWGK